MIIISKRFDAWILISSAISNYSKNLTWTCVGSIA